MVNVPLLRRRSHHKSILDLPFTEYDPLTHLPIFIPVGERHVTPFVSLQSVRDHLTILTAFHTFRASFDEQAFERVCVVAACDYRRWVSRMLPVSLEQGKRGDELELPASAVLMCWHAHMLNPGVYHRDLDGAYRSLRGRAYPVHEVAEALRYDTIQSEIPRETDLDESELETTVWGPLEIAAAVQRQGKFITNMANIGWLDPGAQDKIVVDLLRGIVRYRTSALVFDDHLMLIISDAWLDLMQSSRGKHFLVPTLDIDLAWHTHQLSGEAYRRDTEDVLGMFLDHDDNAGEGRLGDGLDLTGKLWKERFGYEYTF